MNIYAIVKISPGSVSQRYWNCGSNCWGGIDKATRFNDAARLEFKHLPPGSQWGLFSPDGEVVVKVRCPECKECGFEEIMEDVTVTTQFRNVTVHVEDGATEPEYGECENAGGRVSRYQCAHCGFVVARSVEEFQEWAKARIHQ